jgi:hypothetical protein
MVLAVPLQHEEEEANSMAERTENEKRPELEQLRVLHQALQQEDPVQQELAHYQRHACVSPKKNNQDQEWITLTLFI